MSTLEPTAAATEVQATATTPANGNGHGNRANKGRATKPVEAPATTSEGTAAVAVAEKPLIESGPKSSREFYEFVKSLDPEGKNGVREFLVQWGREEGYPPLVKEWSDAQAQAGYERLKAHLEASAEQ